MKKLFYSLLMAALTFSFAASSEDNSSEFASQTESHKNALVSADVQLPFLNYRLA